MTETQIDPHVLDALGLYQGERILWSQLAEVKPPESRSKSKLNIPWELMLFGYGLPVLAFNYRGLEDALIKASIWGVMIACLSVLVRKGWLMSLQNFFATPEPIVFLSAVITDRRIFLFNATEDKIISIRRNRLTRVSRDYAEGSPALLFHSPDQRIAPALIGSSDFAPVLRALERYHA